MRTTDWISTKDRLPETNNKHLFDGSKYSDPVLICLGNNKTVVASLVIEEDLPGYPFPSKYWRTDMYGIEPTYSFTHVKYWQEIVLPETK